MCGVCVHVVCGCMWLLMKDKLSSKKGREAKGREEGHQPSGLVASWEKQHPSQQNREQQSITIQLRCVCARVCVSLAQWPLQFAYTASTLLPF